MLTKLGERFTHLFLKYMPNAFVFAIVLTLTTALGAYFWLNATPLKIITSWYDGFFDLLEFAMQIVLLIITGFSIALSPIVKKGIDALTRVIKTPQQVYFFTVLLGALFTMFSFGWIVITCVLARELALRIKGVNYPFLIAIVYFSGGAWVTGLSSSIPLLLNTDNNYLMEAGVLNEVIPISFTLGSNLNLIMILIFLIAAPVIILLLAPKKKNIKELNALLNEGNELQAKLTIEEEAASQILPFKAYSDKLNNSFLLQLRIGVMGLSYIVYHFVSKGVDLNFNIMSLLFLIGGLLLHKTPMRYVISMKRASSNVSGILFQYPFYAGIMGIMLYTGLGTKSAEIMASVATLDSFPFFAYITGAIMNFAIPSAGGEFAVVGPSIINAVQAIGQGLPADQITAMISRASMSVAYGESLSNLLQPFYLLLVLPVMGAGIKLEARDIMGYLVIPFCVFFCIQAALLVLLPY